VQTADLYRGPLCCASFLPGIHAERTRGHLIIDLRDQTYRRFVSEQKGHHRKELTIARLLGLNERGDEILSGLDAALLEQVAEAADIATTTPG
jgi:hypothetical protein